MKKTRSGGFFYSWLFLLCSPIPYCRSNNQRYRLDHYERNNSKLALSSAKHSAIYYDPANASRKGSIGRTAFLRTKKSPD